METDFRKKPTKSNPGLILGTGLLLLLVFLGLIVAFVFFSLFSSDIVGKCVAVVDINHVITVEGAPSSLLSSGVPGSEDIAASISALNNREDVGALLLVINSPGGSAVATREIYDAVNGLKKPKVSYLRETAASGGYYLAAGTDYIVSNPNTLTGSIGVISEVTSLSGLFEKIGINSTAITSGPYKDIGSSSRPMTDAEKKIFQSIIDEIYQEFRSVVLQGRGKHLDMSKFDQVTDGRVLSGRQAYSAGLVDQLGTKKDAIIKAAQLANITFDSPNEIRICQISTSAPESGGLFSAESLVHSILLKDSGAKFSYK